MRGVTNGQRLLVETGASLGTIARACGVSRPTAQRWKRGESSPRDDVRALLRDAFEIGVDQWDVALPAGFEITPPPPAKNGRPKGAKTGSTTPAKRAKKSTSKRAPKSTSKKSEPVSVREVPPYPKAPSVEASIVENLRYSLSCIRHDLEHRDLTTSARSKLRSDEARTLGNIAKWQRDEELSEDRYVRQHPAFAAHCDSILEALKPCPDCLARVAKALRK